MKQYRYLIAALLLLSIPAVNAQMLLPESYPEEDVILKTNNGNIHGTLLIPKSNVPIAVALIISGSGPTDRDGNNPMFKNNSLKMLAELLASVNIASLRYDKRGIGASKDALLKEEDIRFNDYVNDASAWIIQLKADKRFSNFIVIGHSEGSLIGMLAAKNSKADVFVSIAGVASRASDIILTQLGQQSAQLRDVAQPIIEELLTGKTVEKVPQMLQSIFRPSVQPYIISWFKYDPQEEIKNLTIPCLILQGSNDIQVGIEEAKLLASAASKSQLNIIDGMNHVLKSAPTERNANIKTYNHPTLPLHNKFCKVLTDYLRQHPN